MFLWVHEFTLKMQRLSCLVLGATMQRLCLKTFFLVLRQTLYSHPRYISIQAQRLSMLHAAGAALSALVGRPKSCTIFPLWCFAQWQLFYNFFASPVRTIIFNLRLVSLHKDYKILLQQFLFGHENLVKNKDHSYLRLVVSFQIKARIICSHCSVTD